MNKDEIIALAERFETAEFINGDPSFWMHQVEGEVNQEVVAFVASALSYGNRKQFMQKIKFLVEESHGDMVAWLHSDAYKSSIPDNDSCFYRLYSNGMILSFLNALKMILVEWGSIKEYMKHYLRDVKNNSTDALDAVEALTEWFREHGSVGVIPKNTQSSCKRICMFLRWMVRDNSPVDLGLWSDIIDKKTLIVPMDTHVVQESYRYGLTNSKATSMSAAKKLSATLRTIFPDDPLKGDFALFGIGILF